MPHNAALPAHRYVWVLKSFVYKNFDEADLSMVRALWFGVSATPARTLGCHLLLENGAMVLDLPIHALRSYDVDGCAQRNVWLPDVAHWDCYGWDIECWQPPAISGLACEILDSDHHGCMDAGTLWFCVDHVKDGYSMTPEQHKHHWVVESTQGLLYFLPQDRLLVHDASFTSVAVGHHVPQIKRQTHIWVAE